MRLMLPCALAILGAAATAEAYPEFQLSTGATRCGECHFSPTGGGMINDYGRDESATTIADAGDGRFLHGLVEPPEWLAAGGELRLAGFAKEVRDGMEAAAFPMQADLQLRLAVAGWSATATAGVLAAARQPKEITDRLGSREHYVSYRSENGWYLRAGRYFPAFGLRLPDHTAYVRRYTGQHTLEEPYGIGGGWIGSASELHWTAFLPIAIHPVVGRHGWGGAVAYERVADASSWTLQARAMDHADGLDAWVGTTSKRWWPGAALLLLGEADAGVTTLSNGALPKVAAYLAAHYRPGRAWGLAGAVHYFDADLRYRGQERSALELRATWFPRAHFELQLLGRSEWLAGDLARPQGLVLLQSHYWL